MARSTKGFLPSGFGDFNLLANANFSIASHQAVHTNDIKSFIFRIGWKRHRSSVAFADDFDHIAALQLQVLKLGLT